MKIGPHLPVLCLEQPQPPFAVGSRVVLCSCPSCAPGIVMGMRYGRVLVHWVDLRFTGRHQPSTLMLAPKP